MTTKSQNILQVKQFLKNNRLASLATVAPQSGNPEVVVVYYEYDDQYHLYFATPLESKKTANMIKHPNVSLCIFHEKKQEILQIHGRATIITDSGERVRVIANLYKRISHGNPKAFDWPIIHMHPKDIVLVEVRVSWFKYEKFNKHPVVIEGKTADLLTA